MIILKNALNQWKVNFQFKFQARKNINAASTFNNHKLGFIKNTGVLMKTPVLGFNPRLGMSPLVNKMCFSCPIFDYLKRLNFQDVVFPQFRIMGKTRKLENKFVYICAYEIRYTKCIIKLVTFFRESHKRESPLLLIFRLWRKGWEGGRGQLFMANTFFFLSRIYIQVRGNAICEINKSSLHFL